MRWKFDGEFREGTVRIVQETAKSIAQVARALGINEGILGSWVGGDRRARVGGDGRLSESERAELDRGNAELAMERDVLKHVVAQQEHGGHADGRTGSVGPPLAQASLADPVGFQNSADASELRFQESPDLSLSGIRDGVLWAWRAEL